MIIANSKPIKIIGYPESSMTAEFVNEISKTHAVEVITPAVFLKDTDRNRAQYILSVSFDLVERQQLINLIDSENLDLITVVSDTTLLGKTPAAIISPGTFIFPFCHIAISTTIGRHCIIGSYCLVAHYSTLGNNCILRPGVMIIGKASVGNNCVINTRSTIANGARITNDVEILGFTNVVKDIAVPGKYLGSTARKQKNI